MPVVPDNASSNARGRGRRKRGPRRGGLTLLELILALALTTLVLMAIGMAVSLHLRALQSRRADVEEALLARAILQRMAADLRSAVQSKPVDFSGAMAAADALPTDALGGGEEGERGDQLPEEPPPDVADDGTETDETGQTQSIATTVVPPQVPGLYGTQYELQVDISRLPRIDEYQSLFSPDGTAVSDIPSDVKTVAYYLAGSQETLTTGDQSAFAQAVITDPGTGGEVAGLVRRQLDRAVTQFAADNGGLDSLETGGQLIAPEVTYLEFRYFDGTQWLTEWDSEENGGLPVAVEIAIAIEQPQLEQPSGLGILAGSLPEEPSEEHLYRLVVYLPMAEVPAAEEAEVEELEGLEEFDSLEGF